MTRITNSKQRKIRRMTAKMEEKFGCYGDSIPYLNRAAVEVHRAHPGCSEDGGHSELCNDDVFSCAYLYSINCDTHVFGYLAFDLIVDLSTQELVYSTVLSVEFLTDLGQVGLLHGGDMEKAPTEVFDSLEIDDFEGLYERVNILLEEAEGRVYKP